MGRKRYAAAAAALVAAATVAGSGGVAAGAAPAGPGGVLHLRAHAPVRASASASAVAAPDPGAQLTAVTPTRVLDTRNGTGTFGATNPVGPGGTITVDLSTAVPAGAEAVVLNLAGTEATASTFVTLYPSGAARPVPASNLNLTPGQTRSNAATVVVNGARTMNIYNNAGFAHLIIDVQGYYVPNVGSEFHTLPPTRVLDTRFGTGTGGSHLPVPPRTTLSLDLSGQVPADATAVTFNLAGTEGNANTFVTAYPANESLPTAANLNLVPGETSPNLVTVKLSPDKRVGLFNNNGTVHLVADLAGYFTPDTGAADGGTRYFAFEPVRLFDTRTDTGFPPQPLDPDGIELSFPGAYPDGVTSLVASLAGTEATAPMFVVAWPATEAPPNSSNLNLVAGQTAANLITVAVHRPGEDGTQFAVDFRNNNGTVHMILDLAGVFAPPVA